MVDRTRNNIVQAFNHLISKLDFEQITAKKIADEADISKATFYRYFKDKYEVMNYNYKALLDGLLIMEECQNYHDLFYYLFDTARRDWYFLRHAFNSTGVNSFSNYIYEYSKEAALTITLQNRNGQGFTPTEELQVDVFCNGISYMYKQWIFGQYNFSSSEAADALFAMMPITLRDYWYVK